jgi:hypothetical protein
VVKLQSQTNLPVGLGSGGHSGTPYVILHPILSPAKVPFGWLKYSTSNCLFKHFVSDVASSIH